MVRRLKLLYEKLGRAPKAADLDRAALKGETLSFTAYKRVFGDSREALRAARIPIPHLHRHDRKTMLRQIKALSKKLGRMPRSRDLKEAAERGEILHVHQLIREFGSYYHLYTAAGWHV